MKINLLFFQKYWAIIGVIILATLLRTWNLQREMIFFGDAAHDILVAIDAVEQRTLPLLGIASSIPRFHQGPLTIWMEMVVYVLFGHHLLAFGLFFAGLSILAVIFLYEILVLFVDKTTALFSSFLLATFPLAVANGRTPYHTTPIPFFLILYFFALMQLWQKKKWGMFWAVLSFCGLFQFELATLPFALLIPYVLWRQKRWKNVSVAQVAGGFLLGLAPQILYDLTHRFSHMGGFAIWVVYRVVALFGYKQEHTFSLEHLSRAASSFQLYLSRTWAGEYQILFIVMCLVFCFGVWQVYKRRKLPMLMELVIVGLILQTLAYIIHGSPSEAYFPPFFVLTAIFFGYTFSMLCQQQQKFGKYMLSFFVVLYCAINVFQIVRSHFYVDASRSFSYGYGTGEQRAVVKYARQRTQGKMQFVTLQPDGKFPNYFDNLRWMGKEHGLEEDRESGTRVYVEPKNFDFPKIVDCTMVPFPSVDLYFVEGGK